MQERQFAEASGKVFSAFQDLHHAVAWSLNDSQEELENTEVYPTHNPHAPVHSDFLTYSLTCSHLLKGAVENRKRRAGRFTDRTSRRTMAIDERIKGGSQGL